MCFAKFIPCCAEIKTSLSTLLNAVSISAKLEVEEIINFYIECRTTLLAHTFAHEKSECPIPFFSQIMSHNLSKTILFAVGR